MKEAEKAVMGAEAKTNGDEVHELATETKAIKEQARAENEVRDHEEFTTEEIVSKEKQVVEKAAEEAQKKAEE